MCAWLQIHIHDQTVNPSLAFLIPNLLNNARVNPPSYGTLAMLLELEFSSFLSTFVRYVGQFDCVSLSPRHDPSAAIYLARAARGSLVSPINTVITGLSGSLCSSEQQVRQRVGVQFLLYLEESALDVL